MSAAPEPWHAALTGLLITLFGALTYGIRIMVSKHRPGKMLAEDRQEAFRRQMEADIAKLLAEQRKIDRRISDLSNQVDWLREQVIGANGK